MPEVVLPDGRVLAYREYGAPDGRPVLCNHGGLVCGQDVSPADTAARALGLRLISPDRPGIGSSTPRPGRTTAEWADDIEVLARALGLRTFGAFGWSLGGQYAMALGARLPQRVRTVVVVAGCPPDLALEQLNPADRRFVRASQASVPVASLLFGAIRTAALLTPSLVDGVTRRDLCPADQAALQDLAPGVLAHWMAVAMTRPSGMVEEYRAMMRPWGFAPEEVVAPTVFWQGERDTLVSPQWAVQLRDRTPGATLRSVPGDGHFLAYRRWHEVLGAFARD